MKKMDIIIIIFILLLTVLTFVFTIQERASKVIIEVDGKFYASYGLNANREVIIDSEYGKNKIIIENKKVYITESSCKDKIEIKSGGISRAGQSLICLPNRLVVMLKGELETIVNTY